MNRPAAGSIVLVDWRLGAIRAEPSKVRPAVIVEGDGFFPDAYPNTIVVPLTTDEGLAYPTFSERIEPTTANRCKVTSWALAHHVTTVSLKRVKITGSSITAPQLERIRRRIGNAVGAVEL